jgi:ATPase involved in DNA replication initiation
MASSAFAPDVFSRRRVSLTEIDAAVSARLGPTRGLGNSQPACFNRQVGMYLARHVGRWSTTVIGRFYNGRDHSTVCYGIQRIEALRESDPDVDALIADLKTQLSVGDDSPNARAKTEGCGSAITLSRSDLDQLADLIAACVCGPSEGNARYVRLIRS